MYSRKDKKYESLMLPAQNKNHIPQLAAYVGLETR